MKFVKTSLPVTYVLLTMALLRKNTYQKKAGGKSQKKLHGYCAGISMWMNTFHRIIIEIKHFEINENNCLISYDVSVLFTNATLRWISTVA